MKIEFGDRKLEKRCASEATRLRAFGKVRAKKLAIRLTSLEAAEILGDLRNVPGRFHELTGDLDGELAADLDHPYRLIFEPAIPDHAEAAHADGLAWSLIKHVRILRIEDYHD
ncbi:MAG: type II toxin-antitoxin system RelE/ParE family toxin [Planctomycetota bacterium]